VSQLRGALDAPSGSQDHIALSEFALDQVIAVVAAKAQTWAATSTLARAQLLEQIVRDTFNIAEEWNDAACEAKGYDPRGAEGGEELFAGIGTFVTMAQALRRSMLDLASSGRPNYPGPVSHKPGERIAVGVAPASLLDRVLFPGVTGEVWMEPGVTEADVRATQGELYRDPFAHAGVSLVLAAGNVASLGPRDVLTKLFVDGKVVVLKANPVNDYLVPYWELAMASLLDAGFLRIVSGGPKVGEYLTRHEAIHDIHVTGSDKTHDAIVFGSGESGQRRKASNEPLVTKPVTCELGNVSPVVVVPGRWSKKEISYQAKHVATMLVNNAGFNCLTPRVIVTHAGWDQREEFLAAVETVLGGCAPRRAYYPGARERRDGFVRAHPDARRVGEDGDDTMAWTVIRDVDPHDVNDICFNVEAFCALTSETALVADSPADFVRAAIVFCNDVLWGTLSMTILADPRTLKDAETGPAIERAVADLRYGSIGVNLWHAFAYAFATTVWGAYPGHPITDIQSGRGFVGNGYLFARPQKSVVRGSFVSSTAPAWFATNTNAGDVMRKLLALQVRPSWTRLPALMAAALRG
jgi:acyl-CoA reductase-like NAD-dependent aldehyde dehydrogenase